MDVVFEQRVTGVEQHFRLLNEVLAMPAADAPPGEVVNLVWECPIFDCVEPISIPIGEYRAARSDPARFVVRPEHMVSRSRGTVRRDGYWIVRRPASSVPGAARVSDRQGARAARVQETALIEVLRVALARCSPPRMPRDELEGHVLLLQRHGAAAREAAASYERALSQYRQLMRHRIANPVTVICGLAETIGQLVPPEDGRLRELLETLCQEARRLEAISVDPAPVDDTERVLDPWPSADRDLGRAALPGVAG